MRDNGTSALKILPGDWRNGSIVIGREPPVARFTIDEPSISRQHLKLEWRDAKLYAEDMGSLNGTTVDGKRLAAKEKTEVTSGAMVALGAVTFQVKFS